MENYTEQSRGWRTIQSRVEGGELYRAEYRVENYTEQSREQLFPNTVIHVLVVSIIPERQPFRG